MKKTISILGSTGSIGLTALKIINKKKNLFQINLLSANKNFNLICKQIKYYKPNFFVVNDPYIYLKVKKKNYRKTKILNNFKNFNFKRKNDITVSAIPGLAGLLPTLIMIKKSKKLLIANKEAIICGWNLINIELKKNKTKLIPVTLSISQY